jgi:predicted lipid-binding transport protein (Tim44 family)
MKKFLLTLMLAVSALSMVVSDADARRLGGGRTIGRQSQNVTQKAAPAPSQATNQAKPAAPGAAPGAIPPKPSPWKGILGGALLGLGLGALLSHFGMGGALGSMISTLLMVGLLAVAVMFIIRMFRRKDAGSGNGNAHGMSPSYPGAASSAYTPEIGSRIEPTPMPQQPAAFQAEPAAFGAAGAASAATWSVPADFDVPGFLRHAKTYFIRLQAAWDKADIDDIREFTTPEMYAELKLDLQERGSATNNTDVVSINAELMGIETVGANYLASVKFDGMIKEDAKSEAAPFAEVWNLSKPLAGQGGWVLAGIQQLS